VSRTKFKVIVCNDIDGDLINLYNAIKENTADLIKRLSVLPFSRELRTIALELLSDRSLDQLTRAVLLFYLTRASFFGIISRRGSFAVSKKRNVARSYSSAVGVLAEYAKKFRDVVLENKDYSEVLRLYDGEHTLFYLDPPYVSAKPTQERETFYRHAFTLTNLKAMARLLGSVKGEWVLKIAEDNYKLIRNDLPRHDVAELKIKHNMLKVKGGERPYTTLILAHRLYPR